MYFRTSTKGELWNENFKYNIVTEILETKVCVWDPFLQKLVRGSLHRQQALCTRGRLGKVPGLPWSGEGVGHQRVYSGCPTLKEEAQEQTCLYASLKSCICGYT